LAKRFDREGLGSSGSTGRLNVRSATWTLKRTLLQLSVVDKCHFRLQFSFGQLKLI